MTFFSNSIELMSRHAGFVQLGEDGHFGAEAFSGRRVARLLYP